MTPRALVIASVGSRPATVNDLVGVAILHGLPHTRARDVVSAVVSDLLAEGELRSDDFDGVAVLRLATANYEPSASSQPQQRKPVLPKQYRRAT